MQRLLSQLTAPRTASLCCATAPPPAVFAPSNAAFTAALLSGSLWQQLLPGAAADGASAADGVTGDGGAAFSRPMMQRLLLDHVAPGRWTLEALQQLTANSSSSGDSGCGGALLTMASGRQANVTAQSGECVRGGSSTFYNFTLTALVHMQGAVAFVASALTLRSRQPLRLQAY